MKPHEVSDKYDNRESQELGRPRFFDPDHYLDSVEQMVSADEVLFALEMIKNMPGFYRDNPTQRQKELLKTINHNMASLTYYVNSPFESYEKSLAHERALNTNHDWSHGLGAMIDIGFCYPRGPYMVDLIKELNDKDLTPFIWEMGPSNYWLPYGLSAKDLKFNYYGRSLHKEAQLEAMERLKDYWRPVPEKNQTQIFCCFEVIEHLTRHEDILQTYHEYGADADYILISTPRYTLLGGNNTMDRVIEHVRTFTPKELSDICTDMWPTHDWKIINYQMQVMVGTRKK